MVEHAGGWAVRRCNRCNRELARVPCPACRCPEFRLEVVPVRDAPETPANPRS